MWFTYRDETRHLRKLHLLEEAVSYTGVPEYARQERFLSSGSCVSSAGTFFH